MTVNLKEGPGADPVGGVVSPISDFSGPECRHWFRLNWRSHARRPCLEHYDACDFWKSALHSACPFSDWSAWRPGFTGGLDQQLRILCINKELNLANPIWHRAFAPHLPEGGNGAIDQ